MWRPASWLPVGKRELANPANHRTCAARTATTSIEPSGTRVSGVTSQPRRVPSARRRSYDSVLDVDDGAVCKLSLHDRDPHPVIVMHQVIALRRQPLKNPVLL